MKYRYNCYTIVLRSAIRFDWSPDKSEETYRKRGYTFEQIVGLFHLPHFVDQRSDDPEQYIAIGIVGVKSISVIFEYREIDGEECIWIVTYWKSTPAERRLFNESQGKK